VPGFSDAQDDEAEEEDSDQAAINKDDLCSTCTRDLAWVLDLLVALA